MDIVSCVPLSGRGVIARYGALVAVTDGGGPAPDPLLGALEEVAAVAGDGSDLVMRATRAALAYPGQPSWGCAGVTADGGVAVLVWGAAVATVRVAGGQEATLTATDPVVPASWKFTGATMTIGLAIGETAAPDPRFWLGGGVVRGGGLAVTVSAAPAGATATMPDAAPSAGVPEAPASVVRTDGTDAARASWSAVTALDMATAGPQPLGNLDSEAEESDEAVHVEGVLCDRGHFNDPAARTCRRCGIILDQPPRNFQRRPRPALGVLVLDDGTMLPLDADYVLGREPVMDGDVLTGRARPLRISDPGGTVSRLHLRISLIGWQVEVADLGSANGSALHSPGGERHHLVPLEPTVIQPGARITVGQRTLQYLAYQGVLS